MNGTTQACQAQHTFGLRHSISIGPFIVLVEKSLGNLDCWKVTLYGSTEDTKACFVQHILTPDAGGGVLDTYTAPMQAAFLAAALKNSI